MEGEKMEQWEVHLTFGDKISGKLLLVLLEQIHETGSINKAVEAAGVSYRSGWNLLNKTEDTLGKKLIQRQSGGQSGGGSALTADGLQLLGHMKSLQRDVEGQFKSILSEEEKTDRKLMIASTTEPITTGLLDVLEQAFLQSTGIAVFHMAAGSGRALEMAKAGRVDGVLTHAPELEDTFVKEGWGVAKRQFMEDAFVLIGPIEDPAKVSVASSMGEALLNIQRAEAPFISRADRSGTHLKEEALWDAAGIDPKNQRWYVKANTLSGNDGVLILAEQQKAYALVDMATFTVAYKGDGLRILRKGDPGLENVFSFIPVSRSKAPVNQRDGEIFAQWLISEEAKTIMEGFGKSETGEPLFKPILQTPQDVEGEKK